MEVSIVSVVFLLKNNGDNDDYDYDIDLDTSINPRDF